MRAGVSSGYRLRFEMVGVLARGSVIRVYLPDVMNITALFKVYCLNVELNTTRIANTSGIDLSNFQVVPTSPITLTFTNLTNPSTTTPHNTPISIKTYLTSNLLD